VWKADDKPKKSSLVQKRLNHKSRPPPEELDRARRGPRPSLLVKKKKKNGLNIWGPLREKN